MTSLQDALAAAATASAQQDYSAALQAATKAATLDSTSVDAQLYAQRAQPPPWKCTACPHRARADAAYHLCDPTTALEAYNAVLALEPDNLAAYKGLVKLHEASGDRDETIKALHKLVRWCTSVSHPRTSIRWT